MKHQGIDDSVYGPMIKKRFRSRWFRVWWRNIHNWTNKEAYERAFLRIHEIPWHPDYNNYMNRQIGISRLNQKSRGRKRQVPSA